MLEEFMINDEVFTLRLKCKKLIQNKALFKGANEIPVLFFTYT